MNAAEWVGTGAAFFAVVLGGTGAFGPRKIRKDRSDGKGGGGRGPRRPVSWDPGPGGEHLPVRVDDLDAELAVLIKIAGGSR